MAQAHVEYWISTEPGGYGEILGPYNDDTDAQGKFVVTCEISGGDYWGTVYASTADVTVNSSGVLDFSGGPCFDSTYIVPLTAAPDPSHVFTLLRGEVIPNSRSFFQRSRGHLRVSISSSATNSAYYPTGDYVIIADEHVGLSFGDFIVAHEYGHAMHEKALAGNAAGGNCPSPHYLSGAHNLKCALSEGFANYHSGVTKNTSYTTNFENNVYYPGTIGSGNRNDGSIIEGAVAAFLYDLTDPANEGHDLVSSYPGSYIANMIRTCEVLTGSYRRANGIDDMIACFERQLPNYSMYFLTRSPDPTAFRESATEPGGWSAQNINRLWKKNLYGQ